MNNTETEGLYEYMRGKLKQMHNEGKTGIYIGYEEFARLYQMVCCMRQIRLIANGWE